MRTTLNLDEALYREAVEATGVEEKTRLIHMGLKALIQGAAYKRVAQLFGKIPEAKLPRRRRIR
ncbi:MAG: type II toxin-antitoxin system VapB family antitoxin [Deltaproteobacteria bacterium]|nr:type II toxin-antitoxin system VapB family antitoxin [Deltaproteobacteria bacterium]